MLYHKIIRTSSYLKSSERVQAGCKEESVQKLVRFDVYSFNPNHHIVRDTLLTVRDKADLVVVDMSYMFHSMFSYVECVTLSQEIVLYLHEWKLVLVLLMGLYLLLDGDTNREQSFCKIFHYFIIVCICKQTLVRLRLRLLVMGLSSHLVKNKGELDLRW